VFEMTGHVVGHGSKCAARGGGRAGGGNGGKAGGKDKEEGSRWASEEARSKYSASTLRSMECVDEGVINYDALTDLMTLLVARQRAEGAQAFLGDWPDAAQYLKEASKKPGGAVLVFLPGAPEISRLQRALMASDKLASAAGGRSNVRVLPLHGSLSSGDQTKVFARPPPGTTKIVIATNVAETSITIDDVSFVVDCGRAKEMSHDAERGILRLQEGWVSRAACVPVCASACSPLPRGRRCHPTRAQRCRAARWSAWRC